MATDFNEHRFDVQRLDRIGNWMQAYVDQRKYAGSSVLIKQGGVEVYFNACGQRSVENDLPFERDTVARIYSMTKPITTVGVMMLVERGLFTLDTPISKFIPSFSDMQALVPGATAIDQVTPCATPTVHHLLTHTSGLSYPFNPGVLAQEMEAQDLVFKPRGGTLAEQVELVAALPLAFEPGTRWEYSVGIDILGRIIEIVSGKSLDQFLKDEIFLPLGMTDTEFSVRNQNINRFASLYTPLEGNAMDLNAAQTGGSSLRLADEAGSSPFEAATVWSGGGGLLGTLDDYMLFAEMIRQGGKGREGHLLSPKTLDFMMSNHLPGDIASMGPQSFAEQPMEGMGFGLGGAVVLDPARARCPGSIGDFSWGGMASTFFWVDPVLDLSVVFFTQLSPSSSYSSRAELKALIHGALLT
ncbi:serine hydrolase [Phaeobacter gallaeciensis]|uniref:Serine hydrolase n=2 Tax=Roseobacteraceae TaxID=2854170 RepID=A0A366WYA6_9RHOB|nr:MULTISPECIES: serine hydrolase domain-containing protein [Roseobacteraceae]MBT3140281.1 beta-lactamase family protein [Falsiruegeria litorea]MBT8171083.1 beta-lactamase family protein [Falsiruegeria litorea]RBW53379.1 serine hydrolase [Phaeobacter gallaeciensis]